MKGDKIGLCLIPYEHATAYMGRLDSPEDEVWDIRSRDPNPGLRVFGRFAEIDTFVALNWDPRSVEWHSRHPLVDRDSLYWHFAIIECQNKWKALFPNDNPIHGKDIHDYVSSNVFSV